MSGKESNVICFIPRWLSNDKCPASFRVVECLWKSCSRLLRSCPENVTVLYVCLLTFGETKLLASSELEIALLRVTITNRYFSFVSHLSGPSNHWEQTLSRLNQIRCQSTCFLSQISFQKLGELQSAISPSQPSNCVLLWKSDFFS